MRLRVAVDWAGDIVEDCVHAARSLHVGAGATDEITIPGDPRAAIRFAEIDALTVVELPASLVSEIAWPDGSSEAISEDRSVTLCGARRAGRLVLRTTPMPEHPTVVRFELLEPTPRRRDPLLAGCAAAALLFSLYVGATLAFVHATVVPAIAGPPAIGAGEAAVIRVRIAIDEAAELADIGESIGSGSRGTGGAAERGAAGDDGATPYARLLMEGFDRYVENDLVGAAERWRIASEVEPARPEAWIDLAQIMKRRGELEAERRMLTRSLAADPDRCEALTNLALLEGRLGRNEEGEDLLARARRHCTLSFVLLDPGRPRAAAEAAAGPHAASGPLDAAGATRRWTFDRVPAVAARRSTPPEGRPDGPGAAGRPVRTSAAAAARRPELARRAAPPPPARPRRALLRPR